MHFLEPSILIALVFSVAGLIAALAAAVVAADKLGGAWYYSEPKARGERARGSRCANVGRRLKRSRNCPVIGRKKHRQSRWPPLRAALATR